jgi:type II secretory pathway component PulF
LKHAGGPLADMSLKDEVRADLRGGERFSLALAESSFFSNELSYSFSPLNR